MCFPLILDSDSCLRPLAHSIRWTNKQHIVVHLQASLVVLGFCNDLGNFWLVMSIWMFELLDVRGMSRGPGAPPTMLILPTIHILQQMV